MHNIYNVCYNVKLIDQMHLPPSIQECLFINVAYIWHEHETCNFQKRKRRLHQTVMENRMMMMMMVRISSIPLIIIVSSSSKMSHCVIEVKQEEVGDCVKRGYARDVVYDGKIGRQR